MEEIEDLLASPDDDEANDSAEDLHAFSWTLENGTTAIKKTDRSVFLYRETVIPQKIREFFSIEDLQPGQKRHTVLWHGNDRFEAFIEKTVHTSPRTRMLWKPDLAGVLRKEFPQWLEFFKKRRNESGDTPSLHFTKRDKADHYAVEFSGASSQTITTEFQIPLKSGDTIDNDTLRAIFQCSSQGGMRRSHKTNSLVLISDHTKSTYEDKWLGKIFHYTGMGLTGEQSLTFHQNKTLVESKENGVDLYLFEVFDEGHYVYIGEVELADRPYLSRQPDIEKNPRDVYIFPLRLKGNKHPPLLKKTLLETKEEIVRKRVHKHSLDELEFQARYSLKESGKREVTSEVYERDPLVAEYAKRKANGVCQLCGKPAPFNDRHGDPFLETHHIIPLAEGGPDIIDNVAALCPNCHRKMHVLQVAVDVEKLQTIYSKQN